MQVRRTGQAIEGPGFQGKRRRPRLERRRQLRSSVRRGTDQAVEGQYTETPVKTDFGWHVILLEDSRPLEAPAFEAIKPQLAQRANQQLVEKMIIDLRTKAKVQ